MQKIFRQVDKEKGIVQITVGDERWYFKEGKDASTGNPVMLHVPSVTWIAGHYPKGIAFYKWLSDRGWDEVEAIKSAAGDKGSKVHHALTAICRGEEVRIDSTFMNPSTEQLEELSFEEIECVQSFVEWIKTLESFKPLAWDVTVFSEKYNYAGTIDLIAKVNGELYIIDFKTSQNIWPEFELQVSAYRNVVESGEDVVYEMNMNGTTKNPIKVEGAVKTAILQVGYRRNKAKVKFTEIENRFDLFKAAQQIWKYETEGEEPRKVNFPLILSPRRNFEETKPTETVKKSTPKRKQAKDF